MDENISWTQLFKNTWQGFYKNHLPATILWILAICLAPALGVIMNSQKSIIIGAAFGLTLLVWVCAFLLIKSTQIEPEGEEKEKASPPLQDELTLLYLFENDFDNLLRHGESRILEDEKGIKIPIKSKVYLDFEAQNVFIGFYIPNTPETFKICVYLAEGHKAALEMKEKITVEASGLGMQPVNSDELKFSGRIFLYHEYPLVEVQKRELYTHYKKHGLAPQFRGADYLFKKKEIKEKAM